MLEMSTDVTRFELGVIRRAAFVPGRARPDLVVGAPSAAATNVSVSEPPQILSRFCAPRA